MGRLWAPTLLVLLTASCGGRSEARYQMVHLYGPPVVAADAYRNYLDGRVASLDGDHDLAIKYYKAAAKAAPDQPELPVAVADEQLVAGRPAESLAAADDALARWPKFAPAWMSRGRALVYLGKNDLAARAFETAIALSPTDEEPYLMAALTYRRLDRPEAAERTYARLVEAVPDSAEGHYRVGRAYAARKDYPRAEEHLRMATGHDRDHFEAAAALADVYRRTGRAEAAARVLRELFDRSGEDPDVGRRLVLVLLEGGERAQALALVETLTADWRPATTRVELAYLYILLGEPAMALAIAEDVLSRDAADDAARLLASRALARQKQWDAALAHAEKVQAQSEYYLDAIAERGDLLIEAGRAAEAVTLLAATLAAHPDEPGLIVALSEAHEKAGHPDQARRVLDDALVRAPEEEALVYARAALEERIGDADRAVAIMRRHLERDPDSVTALNFIGYSYARRGVKLDEAERLLRRAVELRPWDGYVLDSLGWCLYRRGKLAEATALLEQADRLAPGEAEILYHLGEAHLKSGQRKRALDLFVRALGLDPEPDVRASLEERVHTLSAKQ